MLPNLESPHWQELPAWPGPSRFGATLLAEKGKLFLFAGRTSSPGPAREEDYLQDAWRFDLNTHQWTPLASLPHRTMQAAGIVLNHTSMAVLGGSDGHDLPRMGELGERYRIPAHIAVYDLTTNRWTTAGDMPIGVVGAAVVPMENGWMIAGGEYSPTLRTASVFRLSTSVPATPKRGLTR